MMRTPRHNFASRDSGFSLIELALVLMIIGTLMSGVLVAVSQSSANARITTAKAQLREIEEALYGFAQAYGRLPCPATDASSPANYEDLACTAMHGFVPSGTLGIYGALNTDGLLVDPWQNPIRYSVVLTAGAGNPNFTDAASIETFFTAGTAITDVNTFGVCKDVACLQTYSNLVPAAVFSLGANWASYSSAEENLNAGDQTMTGYAIKDDSTFISATYSEENFDDQIVWLSPYVLFNRLVSAGKLP